MKKTNLFALLTVLAVVLLVGVTTFSTITLSPTLSQIVTEDSSAFDHSAVLSNDWTDPVDQGLYSLSWTDPVDQGESPNNWTDPVDQ